jgi:hypothetical protein
LTVLAGDDRLSIYADLVAARDEVVVACFEAVIGDKETVFAFNETVLGVYGGLFHDPFTPSVECVARQCRRIREIFIANGSPQ